ncbi:hypothetical protein RFI_04012, partial [Reticulomyxa filosa]
GVEIISKTMQQSPDISKLMSIGAEALKVLAEEDDLTKVLATLFRFDQFDNKVISEALGLLGNLSLITENANYFADKGCVDVLLNLIHFKCKQQQLSSSDIAVVATGVRALGRLIIDVKHATQFGKVNGMDHLTYLVKRFASEEVVMNAVLDSLQNLANTKVGQMLILDSGIFPM